MQQFSSKQTWMHCVVYGVNSLRDSRYDIYKMTYKQTSTFSWESRGEHCLRLRFASSIVPIRDNENNELLSLVLLGKMRVYQQKVFESI